MEGIFIISIFIAFIACMGLIVAISERSTIATIVTGIILLICITVAIGTNHYMNKAGEDFYVSFENGTYSLNIEKGFEVYKETHSEDLEDIIVSASEDNVLSIQKYNKDEFIVTIQDKHYVISGNVVQKLVEQKAIEPSE